jgi:SsrA-binding protein
LLLPRQGALADMATKGNTEGHTKVLARNRRARHDYAIDDTYEAGLALVGSEVKSIREGKSSLDEAYCELRGREIFLVNATIQAYAFAHGRNHEPLRSRKLLLHRGEIERLGVKMRERGYSLIPLQMYFKGSKVKVEVGLGKGKREHEKREDKKKHEAEREVREAMKRSRQSR